METLVKVWIESEITLQSITSLLRVKLQSALCWLFILFFLIWALSGGDYFIGSILIKIMLL